MFGYINPYDPYLYKKDDVLYKSLYCGICKSIGATCGQVARMSLTYDITFLSAFAHNIMGRDVTMKKSNCIAHPFKKRPICLRDELSDKLAYVNLILCKHKLIDDKLDSKKGGFKRLLFNKGYKKAKKALPEIDRIVSESYASLRKLEGANNGLIDPLSSQFGDMLADISDVIFGDYKTEYTHNLFFYIGKWIYLIDAVDDYDKDVKKGEFNPFKVIYNNEKSGKALLEKFGDDFGFMFNDIFNNLKENFYNIKFYFNRDLLENIVTKGIPQKTQEVINSKFKTKNSCKVKE